MNLSYSHIQILYEISLLIGTSPELQEMVTNVLSEYVKKLNCSSGTVVQSCEGIDGQISFKIIHSIPQNIDNNDNYRNAINSIYNKISNTKNDIFPLIVTHNVGQTSYIMDLPQFGFIYLFKEGDEFDKYQMNSFAPLNEKFAHACNTCIQNHFLNNSVTKYRDIFENFQDVYAEVDMDTGAIIEISPSIKNMSGYTREEMIGKDITQFFTVPEQRLQLMKELTTSGVGNNLEAKLTNRKGDERIVSFSVTVISNELNHPSKVIGTMRDITDRKHINDKRSRNEKNQILINYFSTSLLGSNTVEDILWDITYNCISKMDFVDCIVYMFDDDRSHLVQRAAYGSNKEKNYQIIDPIIIPYGKGIVGSVAKSGKPEIVDNVQTDGRYILDDEQRGSEITVPIVYENEVIGIIDSEHPDTSFFDTHHLAILETIASLAANKLMRVLSIDKIEESDARNTAILESALDCIITIDHKGAILEFNPAAEKTFGYKLSDVKGKLISDTIIPKQYREAHTQGMKQFLKTGSGNVIGKRIEISAIRSNGEEFPVELAISPIKSGKLPVFTAYLRELTEKKEFEKQLQLQSKTLEAAANGIIITDTKGIILWANPSFTTLTGYPNSKIIGKTTRLLKSGTHDKSFYENLWQTILAGKVWQGEIHNRRMNGSTYFEEMTITPVINSENEITNFIAIKQDISLRKEAEQAIRESRERLLLAINGAQLGLWVWDIPSGNVYYNGLWAEMLGYNLDEIEPVLDSWKNLVHPEDLPLMMEKLNDHIDGKTPEYSIDYRMKAKNGEWKWIADHGQIVEGDNDNKAIRAVGVHYDITWRKVIEKELKESERRLKTIIDSIPIGIIIIDPVHCKTRQANPEAIKMFGLKEEEIIGNDNCSLFCESFQKGCSHSDLNEILKVESNIFNANGLQIPVIKTIVPIMLEGKKLLLESFVDISKLKEAEAALKENIKIKTNFVSNVSHELRTPLASILGFSGTILRDKNMADDTKLDFTRIIFEESQRLSNLIEDVLDISRIESGKMKITKELIKLDLVLEEIIQTQIILGQQKNIQVNTNISPDIPELFASPDALKQVFVNLISNAIKFTDPEGLVNIEMEYKSGKISFKVADNGIGIPEDVQAKIFQSFFRVENPGREDQGTGIGLAIVKEIVELHNGNIIVKSEVGKGSSFEIFIPLNTNKS